MHDGKPALASSQILTLEDMLRNAVARNQRLTALLQDIVDADETPDANCSCHINPPCGDCVTYGHMRDLMATARKLAKGE